VPILWKSASLSGAVWSRGRTLRIAARTFMRPPRIVDRPRAVERRGAAARPRPATTRPHGGTPCDHRHPRPHRPSLRARPRPRDRLPTRRDQLGVPRAQLDLAPARPRRPHKAAPRLSGRRRAGARARHHRARAQPAPDLKRGPRTSRSGSTQAGD